MLYKVKQKSTILVQFTKCCTVDVCISQIYIWIVEVYGSLLMSVSGSSNSEQFLLQTDGQQRSSSVPRETGLSCCRCCRQTGQRARSDHPWPLGTSSPLQR